jgi:hypothetical protein
MNKTIPTPKGVAIFDAQKPCLNLFLRFTFTSSLPRSSASHFSEVHLYGPRCIANDLGCCIAGAAAAAHFIPRRIPSSFASTQPRMERSLRLGRGATYCFRKVESPATVAAVVHGRGAGSVVAAQPREKEYVWKTRNKYAPPSL